MAIYLNPKADLIFNKIFGKHPNLVKSLLNALLPLPDGMQIMSVEYLPPENVPNHIGKRYSIIFVECTDNENRNFIVEIQLPWNKESYIKYLSFDNIFLHQTTIDTALISIEPVCILTLAGCDFPDGKNDDYMQKYYLTDENNNGQVPMILVDFDNYISANKPNTPTNLWLKFFTQYDEIDDEMLSNTEISEALNLAKQSSLSYEENFAYQDFLLESMHQRALLKKLRGKDSTIIKYNIARNLKSTEKLLARQVAQATDLSIDEIKNL